MFAFIVEIRTWLTMPMRFSTELVSIWRRLGISRLTSECSGLNGIVEGGGVAPATVNVRK